MNHYLYIDFFEFLNKTKGKKDERKKMKGREVKRNNDNNKKTTTIYGEKIMNQLINQPKITDRINKHTLVI